MNDVTGAEPAKKLRYDLQYVTKQSFRFDMTLVIRQVWKVAVDAIGAVREQPNPPCTGKNYRVSTVRKQARESVCRQAVPVPKML